METRKKKYFVIGGIVFLFMLLSGYGLVAALGPDCNFNRGFHGKGFHPGPHGRDFSEFLLWRLDKKVKGLGLSEAQKEKYDEIRSSIEAHITEGMEDHKRLKEEIHTEINKQDPDVRFLAETVKKKINEISGFMDNNLDLFVEFYESLDDVQKDRILDSIRDRMEHHRT